MSTSWHCIECKAANAVTHKFCEACGALRGGSTAKAADAYVPPWERPDFKPSRPEDPCTEPGCTLTIREHIEAFKRHGARIVARAVTL